MESPRDIQGSRRFRWVGRPSEEELLGPLLSGPRPAIMSVQPPPRAAPAAQGTGDPFVAAPRWRFQGRDLLALVGVAAAIWFAIRGAEGLPFHQSGSLAPAEAADQIAARITLDRQQLRSIPRTAATAATPRTSGNGARPGKTGPGSPGSGTKGHPKPRSSGGGAPLLQATVPGVGRVTVDQPEVPLPRDPTADLPPLPETVPLALGTPTLPLP
jgi:hypothetical protein